MRVWLTIALLCLCATAHGTTYYAATNGISGNTGLTTASPWPLDWALSHAGDSNTIIVMPGTFTGHFVAGSPGQIIQSQIRWQAKLVNDHPSLSTISIFPASASNVTVSGFEVTGAKKASGIFTEANYSTIEWNWVHDNGTNAPTTGFDNGIEAHDLTGTLVQFNLLEHNGNSGTTGHGVYMNGTNCTARGNVARYNNSSGIAFYRDIADNANEGSLNVHIDNNLVYGNSEYQLLLGSQYGREFDLVGNTVLGTNASIGFIYAGQTAPCITVNATNNIFYNIGNTFQLGCGSVVGDYNLMNSAYFTQAHGVITNNPHFKSAGTGLYWLTSDSPARGKGLASAFSSTSFFGTPTGTDSDIGVVQYSPRYSTDARVLDPSPVNGADYWLIQNSTWWVRPGVFDSNAGTFPCNPVPRASVYGTQDGTTYANAWNGITAIPFGAAGVTPGDHVKVCGTSIYPLSFSGFIAYQAVCPIQCSNVVFELDYAPDPGTIFGGCLDRINTYVWHGPDANGVYWTSNTSIAGTPREIQFEIISGVPIRLGHMTNSTWAGSLGSQAFIGGTNFLKTIDGSAPSTNLAIGGLGWNFDLYLSSNTVFQGGTFISAPPDHVRSDNDLGTLIGYYATNMLGPQSIHYTNVSLLNGSSLALYPGYNFWTVSGCTVKDAPVGVYGYYDSKAYTATNTTVTGCTFEGIETTNYPDLDGHAIAARNGVNWVVTHNRITAACTSIDFYVDNTHTSSNNVVADNFIKDSHKNVFGMSGGGIAFEGTTTLGLSISNRIYGNTLVNIGTNATASFEGPGIAVGPSDYVYIANNTIENAYVGIAVTPASAPLNGTIQNNIVSNPRLRYYTLVGTGTLAALGLDYNLYYPAANISDPKFVISPAGTHDVHSVFSTPTFASTDTTAWGAFALQDTSAAINSGTLLANGSDPVGIPYTNDIGAFVHEFGTKYAVTTARNEVGATVDGATAGDIISIPAGTADWTNTLIVLKPVTLQGAGIGNTVLLDDIIEVGGDNTTQSVIDLEATNTPFYRITELTINRGTNRLVAPASAFGTIQVQATKPVRIDHVAFGQPLNRCIYFQGGWGSLVDHCTFIQNDEQGIFVGAKSLFPPADNWGDGSWATATPFGTTNALVIEDCYFEDVRPAPGIGKNAVDSQYGAVWTFRYNTVVNANTGAHGSESGARVRSAKQYELYHNTFTTDGRESTAFNPRGGTGVIWSNTASGYNNLARINVNRSTDSFSTWGGATGTNPFDSNDPFGVYATGTHTGTNAATQLTKSGAGWTPNQWYAYTLTNAASGLFSIITSNTTDTIYYLGAKANLGIANPLLWNTGDTFYIQRVLVVLDQVGYSTGGRMSNNPPSPLTWIGDTSVPLYSWGNSIGGMDEVVSGYPSCQENRDYVNSTPKPGYVALVYPHPWIGGGGSTPPFIIGPPQNITIRVGGNASFSVTASGDSPLAYQWLLSGSEISGATTTVYTTNNVTFNANGAQYSVVVTNAFGSVTSSPALLTVQNLALMSGNIHLKGNAHSK